MSKWTLAVYVIGVAAAMLVLARSVVDYWLELHADDAEPDADPSPTTPAPKTAKK